MAKLKNQFIFRASMRLKDGTVIYAKDYQKKLSKFCLTNK
jgi:hypothetical protein